MGNSYNREIIVSSTPDEAYQALTGGFDRWWTTACNSMSEVGGEITFRFGATLWVMRASRLVPDKTISYKD